MMSAKKNFVNPHLAKTQDYAQVLQKAADKQICPFCAEHFNHQTNAILFETDHWLSCKNNWPYDNTAFHFIIVAKRHLEELVDLLPSDWQEVHSLTQQLQEQNQIKGGALILRFGDTRFTGATVTHLHFHLVVPKLGSVVQFPVG